MLASLLRRAFTRRAETHQPSLRDLYAKHAGKLSDKWSAYLVEYDHVFSRYRQQGIRLLEIGIQNGGSLEIWGRYFSRADCIVGCDINPNCRQLKFDDDRIDVVVGDANVSRTVELISVQSSSFDIVIDDGSHRCADVIQSFALYWPMVSAGGIYVVEDLHTSFWAKYGGSLNGATSSLEFFKRLSDVVNFEHWGINMSMADHLKDFFPAPLKGLTDIELGQVHSVRFSNSMCIIEKCLTEGNGLGLRVVAGKEDLVLPGIKRLNGTRMPRPPQAPGRVE